MTIRIVIAGVMMAGLAAGAQAQMGPVSRADFLAGGKMQLSATDADHDGVITKAELTAMIAGQMGGAPPTEMIDRIFPMMDTNGDGKAIMAEAEASQATWFDKADTNHDGTLTPEEGAAAQAAMMAAAQK